MDHIGFRCAVGVMVVCAGLVAIPGPSASSEAPCGTVISAGSDLQQAIDQVPGSGEPATLCLGKGEFRLRRFVEIERDGLTIRGQGPETILRLDEGIEGPVLVIGDYRQEVPRRSTSNVTVERVSIVGAGAGGSEFQSDHPYLTNSNVVIRRGRGIAIRGVHVTACRSACILTEHDTDDVAIEDNRVSGSVWDGISLNRTTRARVVRNMVRDNKASGITVEHLEGSDIRNNMLSDNKTHGIYLSDSYGNTVADNRFAGNVLSGVFVTCAVRTRAPVQCWDRSMSRDNLFEGNAFAANRSGYTIAVDAAANCTEPGFPPNVSRNDLFLENPNEEPSWESYGRCLRYEAPRSP